MASVDDSSSSPPTYGRIARLRGFLPLNEDASPMATHGHGTLSSLITSRSTTSMHNLTRRPSSLRGSKDAPELDLEESPISHSLSRRLSKDTEEDFRRSDERRLSAVLLGPQMRSQRLIGNSNPRREYYERTNSLVQQYIYIDRLLDSSLPHDLLNEYNNTPSGNASGPIDLPPISEEAGTPPVERNEPSTTIDGSGTLTKKLKRTPRELYKVNDETSPLLDSEDEEEHDGPKPEIPGMEDDSVESGDRIVKIAIYINLAANTILLMGKMVVIVLTSSLSVLASLVDAALDFLSTAIVWTTAKMIERSDTYQYPVGRRRLEPIAIIIMSTTVLIKAACWLWCRLIKNSSVQALAQDAMTDVIFNVFSIIFPLVGFYAKLWWLDGVGGLLLSCYVIFNWAGTSAGHIKNLTGAAATADERNILLYLTMRFAKTIKQIQGLQAYHAGDKLNVEVDIVLDEHTNLRDSHDLGESLQYVLESVPFVDRAFVHQDYAGWNLPTHMQQQGK
ncbi:Metal tolerance 3 [Hyphodiscus hymeniophilus]|uniref:Metal tolerance 3 n=1 Tax=Hyphodiscus hymeniophilus TaxID=353542 RepID=A0A9P6VP72_9HELO|nr:Metal tolerance 3 [Hyphodiscus hymeniophilus]